MSRFNFLFILTFVAITSFAQRPIDDEVKIEKAPKKVLPPRTLVPKPRAPRVPTHGILLILTDPPTATIVIKNSQNQIVKKAESENGELQIEVSPGKYNIEVTADGYSPYPKGKDIIVSPSRPQTVQAYLKPMTGSMIIGLTDPETATVLIDEKKPGDLNIKIKVKGDENQIVLDEVPEGSHTLKITRPNFIDWERKNVQVEGGSITTITPKLQPAIVSLVVKSEPGADIYVDGSFAGRTTDNGELKIPDKYKPGRHTIRVEKDKFESADKTDDFKIGDQTVEVKLTRIKSSPEFSDYFQDGATYWDAPKTWHVNHSKMSVKGQELGLVRNKVYDDFKVAFDISFNNQKGAVWIVRARDKKNYYLFQLSGPKAANPMVFRSFICQNGQLKSLKSDRVVEDLGRPNDSIHITIEAKGDTIKHFIQLKSDPVAGSQLLSILTDNTFSYGGIGFGSIDNEEFEVYFLNITPYPSNPH